MAYLLKDFFFFFLCRVWHGLKDLFRFSVGVDMRRVLGLEANELVKEFACEGVGS